MPSPRQDWIDRLKGLGILIVIAGHCFDYGLRAGIFLFHMPLFFLISGYLLKPRPPLATLKSLWGGLIAPSIAAYLTIIGVVWLAPLLLGYPVRPFVKFLDSGYLVVTWFAIVIGLAMILGGAALTALPRWGLLGLALALLGFAEWNRDFSQIALPYALMALPFALAMLLLGHLLRPALARLFAAKLWARGLVLALGALGPILAGLHRPLTMDVNHGAYGVPLVSVALACLTVAALALIAQSLGRLPRLSAALAWLGARSLFVMFAHFPIIFQFNRWLDRPYVFTVSLVLTLALLIVVDQTPALTRLYLGRLYLGPKI